MENWLTSIDEGLKSVALAVLNALLVDGEVYNSKNGGNNGTRVFKPED